MAKLHKTESWPLLKYSIIFFLFTIIFFLNGSVILYGQPYQFIRYAEDEGLSNTLVKSITSDKSGLVWVATDDGLYRFGGLNFVQEHDELPSKYVKSVYCRSNGDLFASTDLGVVRITNTPQSWKVSLIKKGSTKEVDSLLSFPKTIFEDHNGVLWVSDNHKIYCLKGQDFKPYLFDTKTSTNNYQRSFSFAEDGFGNLFSFSEPGYVFLYDRKTDSFIELELPQRLSNIHCVVNIANGIILVATHDGIFELQTDKQGFCKNLKALKIKIEASYIIKTANDHFLAGTWANGLFEIQKSGTEYSSSQITEFPEKNINHLFLSDDGNVWIGSDNGLFLMKSFLFGAPYQNFSSTYIQSINTFPNGRVCFTDGGKIFSVDADTKGNVQVLKSAKTTVLQALPVPEGIWYSDVNAKIWFENTRGATVQKYDFKAFGGAIFHLMADNVGNLWACQDANTSLICIKSDHFVRQYGIKDGITSRPLSTTMDMQGKVYAGGMADTAFLFVFDVSLDRFTNLSKPLNFESNIDINVNDMAFSRKSILWIGTSFGLIKYEKGIFTRIKTGDMTAEAVKAVAIDIYDHVWFGNSIGLHQLFQDELLSFDERAGMLSKSIAYRCLHFDAKNRIWVGTVSGLVVSAPIVPPVKTIVPIILNLLIDNKNAIDYKASGTIINNKSFVTMKVGVPEYPAKYIRFEILLQGRDSTWIPINKSNEIILANLDPGEYTLLIRARQFGNFLYSNPLPWAFTVKPIWYFRWWVVLLFATVFIVVFRFGIKWYTNKLKKNNEKLEQAIMERTSEISAQKEQIESQNLSITHKNEELEKANIKLQAAKSRAEEATEAKSRFLSVMTHELRTPMNAVIGFSHLLIQNNPRPDQLEDMKTLRFSAENLLALINNILDFNKIEARKISLEQINFNLKNLIDEIISSMKIRAQHKSIELHFNFDNRLPDNVIGDPLRLSQIISNLLSNALKFTEKGSVTIDMDLISQTKKNVLIDISVTDTGIGINNDTVHSIFDAFTQASSETSRKYGGTGLGLAITQKLLELFDSKIQVESEIGKGSRFSFSINFSHGSAVSNKVPAGEIVLEFTPFNEQRILLVEDNKVNKIIAYKFLESWNLKVEIAENGLIAVEKVTQQPFDLILMDLQMPEMDGYQAASAIRHLGVEALISIPIIALTAAPKAEVYENIFLSGMNDFISKPFNPIELHEKISKFLS
jgi:signal transduction histidine kinase/CheY-like chemotaxis protein/ligand-binding sensor domain-containing protein